MVFTQSTFPWILATVYTLLFGRNDAKAETPIPWPPHVKSWLIGKDSDAGRDWGQEEKGTTEDEMAGWHHQLDGREFEWTPGVGNGQGGLACCNSWGCKESDMTERLNWIELNWTICFLLQSYAPETSSPQSSKTQILPCYFSLWNSWVLFHHHKIQASYRDSLILSFPPPLSFSTINSGLKQQFIAGFVCSFNKYLMSAYTIQTYNEQNKRKSHHRAHILVIIKYSWWMITK